MSIRSNWMIPAIIFLYLISYACSDTNGRTGMPETPALKASATPAFGKAPLTVQFGAAGSVASGGGSVTYAWNFDDGNKSDESSPEHTFTFMGTYVVELTAFDVAGAEYTDWVIVIVN